MRALQPPGQSAVLFPQPLLIDEQRKALLESELACSSAFQLCPECFRHSVQFHRIQFLYGGLVQHVESFSLAGITAAASSADRNSERRERFHAAARFAPVPAAGWSGDRANASEST